VIKSSWDSSQRRWLGRVTHFQLNAPAVGWMKCDSSAKAFAATDFPLNLFAICSKTGDMMLDWPPADHQPVAAWLSIGYSGGLQALNYKCQSKLLESAQWIVHQYVKDERRHDGYTWDFCFLRTYFRRRGMFKRKKVVVLPSIINFHLSYGYFFCSLGESICLPMLQKGRRGTYLFIYLYSYIFMLPWTGPISANPCVRSELCILFSLVSDTWPRKLTINYISGCVQSDSLERLYVCQATNRHGQQ
jgi:hypothetical protein